MILFGLALGAVGIKASTNGTGGGIWMIVTFGAVGMMIGAGALGIITTRVRDQKHREKSINTGVLETIENKFFFLMVLLMIVITWLSVYVVFNFDEVKLMAKQGVFIHWQHVWEPLAAETKTDLGKFGCVDEGPPSDSCWDAMQHFLFSSWKLGGFLVMATVVLLPFQIFFVGTRLEWTTTLNSLQTDLCVLMIAMGAALFVLAYTLASAFVVPCVITGLVVIVAGIVQLVPNISCLADVCGNSLRDFEQKSGMILTVAFAALSAANLAFSLWCITSPDAAIEVAGKKFDLYLNDTALTGVSDEVLAKLGHQLDETNIVSTIGWATLLVFEFLVLMTIVNANDWRNGNRKKTHRSPIKHNKKDRRGQEYDELDDAIEEDDRHTRDSRSRGRQGRSPGRNNSTRLENTQGYNA